MEQENQKFGSITLCLDETEWLAGCLDLLDVDVKVVVVAGKTFDGKTFDQSAVVRMAEKHGAHVLYSQGYTEVEQRNEAIAYLRSVGVQYALIVDADEFWAPDSVTRIKRDFPSFDAPSITSNMRYFFRYPTWEVEVDQTPALVGIKTSEQVEYPRRHPQSRQENYEIYHFSYVRTEDEMKNKLTYFSHASEIEREYIEKWRTVTPDSTHFHPVSPGAFKKITQIQLPEDIWKKIPKKYL